MPLYIIKIWIVYYKQSMSRVNKNMDAYTELNSWKSIVVQIQHKTALICTLIEL